MDISFIVPCYRSEHTIEHVILGISKVMGNYQWEYEIILINDYSPDKVWDKIETLSLHNQHIKAISLSRNFGQHSALMAGYYYAGGDLVVSLDDDGQSPVEYLPLMIGQIQNGYDVVYAGYIETPNKNLLRRFGTWMAKKLNEYILDQPKKLITSSFYISKSFVIHEVIHYKNAYPYIGGLVLRTTKNITHIPIPQKDRLVGKSGYSFHKLLSLWLNGLTAFSVKPLRIATVLGSLISVAGFLSILIITARKLINPMIEAGWSSTISIILLIGGVVLLELGMIGEYVGRIYLSLNNAPQYVIKKTINLGETNSLL